MDTEGNRTSATRWTWLRPGRHPEAIVPIAYIAWSVWLVLSGLVLLVG